jgi:DNA-binding transcriptional MerR regulator
MVLLTSSAFAKHVGRARRTLRYWVTTGKLVPAVRMGPGRVSYYKLEQVDEARVLRRRPCLRGNGLTRSEFARRVGVSVSTVRAWERRGWLKPVRYELARRRRCPVYEAQQIKVFLDKKYWRSARGMRVARRALRARNSRNF